MVLGGMEGGEKINLNDESYGTAQERRKESINDKMNRKKKLKKLGSNNGSNRKKGGCC